MTDDDRTLVNATKQCPMCRGAFGTDIAVCPNDGTLLMPIRRDALIGTLFADKYRITEELGRGGMSIVYKGLHELMRRYVAIKIMQHELSADPISVRRFQQEAEAASRLSHPHVITVHDFGVTPTAQPYLILDMVTGPNFADVIKKDRPLDPERVINIFEQICDALEHAHQRGVVHRDMKPSNIMLLADESRPDYVKVLDFGIAKLSSNFDEHSKSLTTSGEVFGSPVYMSPEQCRGVASDHRTDIYSLGVMLYEALIGKPPLVGPSYIETIQMHISTPPRPFKNVNAEIKVPLVLEAIAFKAIQKKPEDRYQSMKEFKEALQKAASELGFQSQLVTGGLPLEPQKKSKLVPAIIAAVLLLSGAALIPLLTHTESVPVEKPLEQEKMTGTIFYYNPDAHPGYMMINGGDGALKIFTEKSKLEDVLQNSGLSVHNGDIWNVAFHRTNGKALLDKKGTSFTYSSEPDVRAVDKLIRDHYSNMEKGNLEEAWLDFSALFVQSLKSKADVFKAWKHWHGVPGCENAPASAIQILANNSPSIEARVDASQFVKGDSKNYLIAFIKENGKWKFQSLKLEDKPSGN